jgi:hypothetical protein
MFHLLASGQLLAFQRQWRCAPCQKLTTGRYAPVTASRARPQNVRGIGQLRKGGDLAPSFCQESRAKRDNVATLLLRLNVTVSRGGKGMRPPIMQRPFAKAGNPCP